MSLMGQHADVRRRSGVFEVMVVALAVALLLALVVLSADAVGAGIADVRAGLEP